MINSICLKDIRHKIPIIAGEGIAQKLCYWRQRIS